MGVIRRGRRTCRSQRRERYSKGRWFASGAFGRRHRRQFVARRQVGGGNSQGSAESSHAAIHRSGPIARGSLAWHRASPERSTFSSGSAALYVYRPDQVPLPLQRLDVATGTMKPIRPLVPSDRAGLVSIAPVDTNPQASEFAYSYYQATSILYVISGLK